MILLPALAAVVASLGWAAGAIIAQAPARAVGAFEFTRIQLIACSALMALLCSLFGQWQTVDWSYWPLFVATVIIGVVLGNLAMIECLRRGGARWTELMMSLRAPLVALIAFLWLGETLRPADALGGAVALAGVFLAILFGRDGASEPVPKGGAALTFVLLGLFAAACQGFGFLAMKPAMLSGTEPLAASAIRLLGAAFVISLVALWPMPAFRSKTEVRPGLLGRVILPGAIGYGLSSSLLLYAFANLEAGAAAVLGCLSPVLVLPILWAQHKRRPNAFALLGALLAVAGTAIIALS